MYSYLIGAESQVEYYVIDNGENYQPVRIYSLVIRLNSEGGRWTLNNVRRIFQLKRLFGIKKDGVFHEAEVRFTEVEDEGRIYKLGKYFFEGKEIDPKDRVQCIFINDISLVIPIVRFDSPYISLGKYLYNGKFRKMDREKAEDEIIINEIEGRE